MCLLEEKERNDSQQGGRHDEYRRCLGEYPDLFGVCSRDAFLVRGGRADHPLSAQRSASFLPSPHRCAWPAAVSGTTRSSIFWPCSWATPSAANARWRSSTSGSCLLRNPSWPCSTARDSPPARRSHAISRA